MLPVGIGEAIRARRERAGLTQESLGALLAVHPDVVDEWEWGESAPDPEQARRLAMILELPERALVPRVAADDDDPAVVIQLVHPDPAGGEDRRLASSGLVPVPPRPLQPPPLPIPPRPTQPPPLPAPTRVTPAQMEPRRPGMRPAVAAAAAALLVATAAFSGITAYQEGQTAARHEAEVRSLRATLVQLAGERDRLAARLADLTGVLEEAGLHITAEPASADP